MFKGDHDNATVNIRYAIGLWVISIALHSADALAWGLYTQVYFAKLLLWAVPLPIPSRYSAITGESGI